jgi:hypothetical protein
MSNNRFLEKKVIFVTKFSNYWVLNGVYLKTALVPPRTNRKRIQGPVPQTGNCYLDRIIQRIFFIDDPFLFCSPASASSFSQSPKITFWPASKPERICV